MKSAWTQYFIDLTLVIASKSKDPSRQVGCVIVGPDKEIRSTGFNGFPRGVSETGEGAKHLPLNFERSLAGNEYHVACSCGDRITIPTSRLDANVHGVFPACHSYTQMVDNVAEASAHFQQQKTVLNDRWERPIKYQYVEHAERNAIYNAARVGTPLLGCTAFVSLAPCVGCARALVQAGIVEVYGPAFDHSQDDDYHFDIAETVLKEGGVRYTMVEYAN